MKNRAQKRGYTAVEVMMAMTLLLIGSVGVMAMQRAAVQGNTDAREMDVASSISRMWMERLERDATLWVPTQTSASLPQNLPSPNLIAEGLTQENVWYIPAARNQIAGAQNDLESPAFDILGQDVPPASAGVRYCVNLRLNPLTTDQTLIRADLRVYWPRNLTQAPDPNYCAPPTPPANIANIGTAVQTYHFVYATTALRQNTQ